MLYIHIWPVGEVDMYFMYMVPVQIQCILYCMVWYYAEQKDAQ